MILSFESHLFNRRVISNAIGTKRARSEIQVGQRKGETAWQIATYKKNEKHMTWDFWGEIRINNYNTLIVLVSFSHKCVQGFYHRGFQKIYIKSFHFEF